MSQIVFCVGVFVAATVRGRLNPSTKSLGSIFGATQPRPLRLHRRQATRWCRRCDLPSGWFVTRWVLSPPMPICYINLPTFGPHTRLQLGSLHKGQSHDSNFQLRIGGSGLNVRTNICKKSSLANIHISEPRRESVVAKVQNPRLLAPARANEQLALFALAWRRHPGS